MRTELISYSNIVKTPLVCVEKALNPRFRTDALHDGGILQIHVDVQVTIPTTAVDMSDEIEELPYDPLFLASLDKHGNNCFSDEI